MSNFVYPDPETIHDADVDYALPVNIEVVKTFRKLHVLATAAPGIQFHFIGGGATIEWSFVSEAARDDAYEEILDSWGELLGEE